MKNLRTQKQVAMGIGVVAIVLFISAILCLGLFGIIGFGTIMIIAGYALRKQTDTNFRILGKIILLAGIALLLIIAIILSFSMGSSTVTNDTITTEPVALLHTIYYTLITGLQA